MAIFNTPQPAAKKDVAPSFAADPLPPRDTAPTPANESPTAQPATGPRPVANAAKESLIASDLTIEGKIEGSGHVRIAGRFKGDVNVQGDLTIEPGAKLAGGVRANKVTVSGELEGNIDSASQVELTNSGAIHGDLKADTLTVASGSRIRGHVECGNWGDKASGRNGSERGNG
jgi:cytoskeletal protein CcmA (bactofilin family)